MCRQVQRAERDECRSNRRAFQLPLLDSLRLHFYFFALLLDAMRFCELIANVCDVAADGTLVERMKSLQQRARVKDLPVRTNGRFVASVYRAVDGWLFVSTPDGLLSCLDADDEAANDDDDEEARANANASGGRVSTVVLFTDAERDALYDAFDSLRCVSLLLNVVGELSCGIGVRLVACLSRNRADAAQRR